MQGYRLNERCSLSRRITAKPPGNARFATLFNVSASVAYPADLCGRLYPSALLRAIYSDSQILLLFQGSERLGLLIQGRRRFALAPGYLKPPLPP